MWYKNKNTNMKYFYCQVYGLYIIKQKGEKEELLMKSAWVVEVKEKIKRKNQILFSRDSACLQELLQQICLQKHRTLVLWAFYNVEYPLFRLKEHMPEEQRPGQAVTMCKLWAEGKVKMPIAKKALLQAHQVAKETDCPEDIALCHAIGQACATVHVETHAIGLAIYELTAIVRRFGIEACQQPIEQKITDYITSLKQCEKEIQNDTRPWAAFLLDESRPNKEWLLAERRRKEARKI